jgi:hypothetical protein
LQKPVELRRFDGFVDTTSDVAARERVQLTGTNRSFGLIALVFDVRRNVRREQTEKTVLLAAG